ncbi:hypothetical protein GCM10022240_28160 [Microbacterium kribbense]|uniref:Uncharacterized protein n=1 Tax=Microbacterium kribbense TaxID=433645 RepID=A0ABP7GSG2_9MICO
MPIDRELLAAWVAASCAAQGVPVFVADPGVLTRVRTLLGAGGAERGGSAVAEPRTARLPLQHPHRLNPPGVELVHGGREDRGVVEHGPHDRGLPF